MRRLADELGVSDRTIRTDIGALTEEHPLQTVRGHKGCVSLPDWYHLHRNIFSREQERVLAQMLDFANLDQAKILREMLDAYGSTKRKESR